MNFTSFGPHTFREQFDYLQKEKKEAKAKETPLVSGEW